MNRPILYILFSFLLIIVFQRQAFGQAELKKEYYPNGKIKSEINYSNGVREGEAKLYYDNGNLKEERFYVNGRIDGIVKYYNEAGKMIEMANLEDGKREGPTSVFDSTGKYIMDINYEKGKKVVEKHTYYEKKPIEKKVAQQIVTPIDSLKKGSEKPVVVAKKNKIDESLPPEIEDLIADVTPEVYTSVEVMPEPVGGPDQIQKKVFYPKEARDRGIQGTVKVLTVIDEYGEVKQATVVEGIGFGCDESARIAVYYTKFKPGLQKGKRVKVQMIVPVQFKL